MKFYFEYTSKQPPYFSIYSRSPMPVNTWQLITAKPIIESLQDIIEASSYGYEVTLATGDFLMNALEIEPGSEPEDIKRTIADWRKRINYYDQPIMKAYHPR